MMQASWHILPVKQPRHIATSKSACHTPVLQSCRNWEHLYWISFLKWTQRMNYMFINLNSFQEYGVFQELQYTLTDVSTKHEYEIAKENNYLQTCQTSLWSCNKIGVFVIGENPKVGIPNCLMNRASVVEANISGFASFPPAAATACLKTDHHGFESSVAVINGRPI